MQYQSGELIHSRYQIIEVIGQGSMGITYSANDLKLSQKVALKIVIFSEITDWKILELFEREAKILATLNHPNIPKYLDFFEEKIENETYFCLVQELIEGVSLHNLVEIKGKLSEFEVKDIAQQCLTILVYLQELIPPIIHRDIKPQNIILTKENKVYLVDFGTVQDIYRNTVSIGGTFVGTFGYMPPEQFRGQAFLSTDLYSLGATLIFLITGKSPADLPQKNLHIDFINYCNISLDFCHWLEKITAPFPEDRFNSAQEALDNLALEIIESINVNLTERINIKRKNNKLLIYIKPLGWSFFTNYSLIQCVLWNYFFVLNPWFILIQYVLKNGLMALEFLWLFLLLGSTVFGLYLFITFLNNLLSYSYLELTPNHFSLLRKSPTMKTKKSGQTRDIVRLEVRSNLQDKFRYSQTHSVVFWYGIKTYLIAQNLTQPEAEKLVFYLADFLSEYGLTIDLKI